MGGYVGLFGYIEGSNPQQVSVINLTLKTPIIAQSDYFSGALAGYIDSSRVEKCMVESGNVTGNDSVGGLIGFFKDSLSTLDDCHASGAVFGGQNTGGLIGECSAIIQNCSSSGSVEGTGHAIGGLVGYDWSSIYSSHSSSSVVGGNCVGGLVGEFYSAGDIINCHATGSVEAAGDVGGLVGYTHPGSISRCYATGSVKCTSSGLVGGLVASQRASIELCYATGTVSGTELCVIGGLVGGGSGGGGCYYCYATGYEDGLYGSTSLLNRPRLSYYLGTGSSSLKGIPLTEEQMKQQVSFVDWDFMNDWMMLREGEDYPRLAWQEVFAGDIAGLYGADMMDFAYLANYWRQDCNTPGCDRADIDGSGDVGLPDLAAIANDWLM